MAFTFTGIFAVAGSDVMEDLQRHFGGIGKVIRSPFTGFGVRLPFDSGVNLDPEDTAENDYATALIKFGERHPTTTFVYLYAECFGGPCEYAGFVFRGGQRIHDEPFRDVVEDYSVLSRLVAHLGVQTGGYFEPLERNYFGEWPPRASVAPKPTRSWWRRRLFGGGSTAD